MEFRRIQTRSASQKNNLFERLRMASWFLGILFLFIFSSTIWFIFERITESFSVGKTVQRLEGPVHTETINFSLFENIKKIHDQKTTSTAPALSINPFINR